MYRDDLSFNIKEVAQKVGVTPATIRNWEKSELFFARRNTSNYRIYNMDDIDLLKRIKYLSIDKKMNSFSIKEILNQEFSLSSPDIFHHNESFEPKHYSKRLMSKKWKKFREEKQLTLDEVSKETGISVSYLSKIENGNANISLDILSKLSEYYGESLLFFYDDVSTEKLKITKEEREPLDIGLTGVYIESLIKRKNTVLRPAIFTVLPNSGQEKSHHHRGEEFIFVLEGEITFTLNQTENYTLQTGDSFSFQSSTPHSWENFSKKKTVLLWVHSPINTEIV